MSVNAEKITTGIFPGLSHRDYRALDAISNSYLKRLGECPAKAKVEDTDTPALLFGRALHCYVLEREAEFFRCFAVAPKVDKRTNAGKEVWAGFIADNPDKEIIDRDTFDKIQAMGVAVNRHPLAKAMLRHGISEVSILWNDPATGLACKCRPDRIPAGDKGVILDLKTTTDASERGFQKSALTYGYHRQAAWYIDGCNANGKAVDAMVFIAVEKETPYRTEVYVLDEEFIAAGRKENADLLRREIECRDANCWPHYTSDTAIDIFKPSWM